MVRKNTKKVKINEIVENTIEEIMEPVENTIEEVENTTENEEIPEVLEEIQVQENNNDIKEVLNHKKKISEKQREHLQKSREIMIQKEKQKKVLMKKFNELVKLDINLDDVIENAKKLKIKNDYERFYGKKKQEEQILEKPRQSKVKIVESESDEEPIRQEKRQETKQDILRNKLRGLF